MNLFRVDFVQGKTDAEDYNQVVHSLTDADGDRKIMTLTLSSDKLQGVSKYNREPKRLNFECFVDSWIESYILSGDYEHERYISHYEVQISRDNVRIFSGIIDTSNLNYDAAEGVISFLCYDKIKLLTLYNDLEMLYTLSGGYTPSWILGYFITHIQQKMPVAMPSSSVSFTIPVISIPGNTYSDMLDVTQLNCNSISTLPSIGDYEYSWTPGSWNNPKYGYILDSATGVVTAIFAHKKEISRKKYEGENLVEEKWQLRYAAKVIVFFSGLANAEYEYNYLSDWNDEMDAEDEKLAQWLEEYGHSLSELDDLETTMFITGVRNHYAIYTGGVIHALICGPNVLPTHIYPGKMYVDFIAKPTNILKVLQSMLLIYNATLVASAYGTIHLMSKEDVESEAITIADNDVVEFQMQRINAEVPETSIMEVLAGNTTTLQKVVKDYVIMFYAGKWQANITIDRIDQYEIELGSTVQINGTDYQVVEVQRDWVADDYKIRAWRL